MTRSDRKLYIALFIFWLALAGPCVLAACRFDHPSAFVIGKAARGANLCFPRGTTLGELLDRYCGARDVKATRERMLRDYGYCNREERDAKAAHHDSTRR